MKSSFRVLDTHREPLIFSSGIMFTCRKNKNKNEGRNTHREPLQIEEA